MVQWVMLGYVGVTMCWWWHGCGVVAFFFFFFFLNFLIFLSVVAGAKG